MKCPGIGGTLVCGVGEVEDMVMIGGVVTGLIEGVGGLLRELLVGAREESGEEDGRMGAFVAPETFGEEVLVV